MSTSSPTATLGARRPNILFMIADDHRYDVLGAAGHPEARTPSLDQLAARGTRFERHHCQGGMSPAICAPSRAEILSGRELFGATASKEPKTSGAGELNPDVENVIQTFRAGGYRTHLVGKWHNGRESLAASFDSGDQIFLRGMHEHWGLPVHAFDPSGVYAPESAVPAEGFSTDVFADATVEFLQSVDKARPFFAWVAFTAPHDPRTPPGEFATMYDPKALTLPCSFRRHPPETGHLDVRDELLAVFPRNQDEVRQHIADYFGMISHLDQGIGRILQALKEYDLAHNTIVVYTSDHGLAVGHHGLMGKQSLYDHSLRVPLIVAGPSIPEGRSVKALTMHADLFPTLAAFAGLDTPETVEGCSLNDLIDDPATSGPHEAVHAAYLNLQRGVSDGTHKLIRYYGPEPRIELYDLIADPCEMVDVADQTHLDVLARLTQSLEAWQRRSGDPLWSTTARS